MTEHDASPFWFVRASSMTTDTWVGLDLPPLDDDPYHFEGARRDQKVLEEIHRGDADALTSVDLVVTDRGRWLGDMLWAVGDRFVAVSDRVVETLRAVGATGWETLPTTLRYKNGTEIPGYHLFVVRGVCGDFTVDLRAGRPPDLEAGWDGSDVFNWDGPWYEFCVTDRVHSAFVEAGLTRVEYERADRRVTKPPCE